MALKINTSVLDFWQNLPMGITAEPGQELELQAGPTGWPIVGFQWFRNGVPVPGGTLSVLRFPSVRASDAGTYRITITNACGNATSTSAMVNVVAATPVPPGRGVRVP